MTRTLRDALSAPFVFRSQTVVSDRSFDRTVAYPELGCEVTGEKMLEMIDELEIARVRSIVAAVAAGRPIAPLRPAVASAGIEDLLMQAGLDDWIPRLDDPLPTNGIGADS